MEAAAIRMVGAIRVRARQPAYSHALVVRAAGERTAERDGLAFRRTPLRFWQVRGHWSEGWNFLERARARSKEGGARQVKALMPLRTCWITLRTT